MERNVKVCGDLANALLLTLIVLSVFQHEGKTTNFWELIWLDAKKDNCFMIW